MNQNRKGGWRDCLVTARTCRKYSTSKASVSTVELSHFLNKKPEQTKMLQNIQIPKETIEESADDTNYDLNNESPYKNLIKNNEKIIFNDSTSDATDFRSPVLTRKQKKTVQNNKIKFKTPVKKKRDRSKRTTEKPSTNLITENFIYYGENTEHMQMAVALSKSSYEAECGPCSPIKEDVSNITEIIRNTKPAFLERFGFTSGRKILPVEHKSTTTVSSEATKKNKNRFKYITPILNIRTNEERNSLIDSKISLVLCENNPQPKQFHEHTVNSNKLMNYLSKEKSVFNLNIIYQKNFFYTRSLKISQNIYRCGYLLKDWNLIPGREKSPSKPVKVNSVEKEISDCKDPDAKLVLKNEPFQMNTISQDSSLCELRLSEPSNLGASCLFKVYTEIQGEAMVVSKLKNARTFNLATSSVQSFSSSCRSVSPELFGSDDDDYQFPKENRSSFTQSSISPTIPIEITKKYSLKTSIASETGLHDSVVNCAITQKDFSQKSVEYINNLEKNSSKIGLSNEIIDLMDSYENESVNTSNKYLSFDVEIITVDRANNQVSSQPKNHFNKRVRTPMSNMYYLDDFEKDNLDKMEASFKNKEFFNDIPSKCYDKCVNDLNRETDSQTSKSQGNYFKYNKDNQESPVTTMTTETCHIKGAGLVEFAQDNVTTKNSFKNIKWISDINNKPNLKNKKKSLINALTNEMENSPSILFTAAENCVDAYIIDDSLLDSHNLTNINKKEIEAKQNTSRNTPQRNHIRKQSVLPYVEVFPSLQVNGCTSNVNNKRNNLHNLEGTPKRFVESNKSSYFNNPILYDSTELNVTYYVNNMLQQNLSFNKIQHLPGDEFEGLRVVNNDEEFQSSQSSQSSVILDEELNYSSHFATPSKVNYEIRNKNNSTDDYDKLEDVISHELEEPICLEISPPKKFSVGESKIVPKATTVTKQNLTPKNFIIKTDNVTPMPEYDMMATPLINKELKKIGVKPLKRTRGAKLLKYLYESTHPFVEPKEKTPSDYPNSDEDRKIIKRKKKNNEGLTNIECDFLNQNNLLVSSNTVFSSSIEIIGDIIIANEVLEDLIFERKQLTKIASCKVPLQIVWHNLVSSNQAIKEKILLYKPLQLESLHLMLKEQGFKFHIQDLLTFLDKKCITIRTAQKQDKMHQC